MLRETAQAMKVKDLFDLTGRVAVVTGGSIGLGRQMAEGLAEMGAEPRSVRAQKGTLRSKRRMN